MIATSSDIEVAREARRSRNPGGSSPPPGWLLDLVFSDVTSWVLTSVAHRQPDWMLPSVVGEAYAQPVLDDPVKYHLYRGLVNSFSLTSLRREGSFNDNQQFIQYSGNPFEKIKAPMLLLQGTEDDEVLAVQQHYLDEVVPNSNYLEIEGGTHYMPASHNHVLALIILKFLEEYSPEN
ncbi:alpha/beta fold hydrolase [Chloroflexota bacterium]